jgi:hypothetical protein
VCAQGADLLAAASAKFKPGAKNQPTKDFLGSGFRAQEYFAQGPGMSTAFGTGFLSNAAQVETF